MKYIINVAKGDSLIHYFRVEVEYGNVKQVYKELCNAFPDYKIDVYCWQTTGTPVDMGKCNF